MKKKITIIVSVMLAAMVMTGCCLKHEWEEATCKDPKTCVKCGKTEGESLDHEWEDATCTEPKTCELCGKQKGNALGHDWVEATCTEPKTCSVCGETEGEANGHEWGYASCLDNRYCYICNETDGQKGEHDWMSATCYSPEYCWYCDETRGERLPHNWVGQEGYLYCDNCYDDMPDNYFDDGDFMWVGVCATLPSTYELQDSSTDLKATLFDDSTYFYIVPHWNSGYSEDAILEFYTEDIYDAYDVLGEDEYYTSDGAKITRFEVTYNTLRGYCSIYYMDNVFMYIETFAKDFVSDAELEEIYGDIMDSIYIYY